MEGWKHVDTTDNDVFKGTVDSLAMIMRVELPTF